MEYLNVYGRIDLLSWSISASISPINQSDRSLCYLLEVTYAAD